MIWSLISLIILGIFSLIALFINRYKVSLAKPVSTVILLLSIISFGLVARTGYLGGQIRHTEITTSATQNNDGHESGDKQKDKHKDDDWSFLKNYQNLCIRSLIKTRDLFMKNYWCWLSESKKAIYHFVFTFIVDLFSFYLPGTNPACSIF